MIVSIGILARNEAHCIDKLIQDIGYQDLLLNDDFSIEIHVVANGCTDDTVNVATNEFTKGAFKRDNVTTFVHVLKESGKSHAWNQFIHNISSPHTDFVFLLDADIQLPENTTLQIVLKHLCETEKALVAIDEAVRDIALKPDKTVLDYIILGASGTAYNTRTAITGQFYCAKFSVLRNIWMPIGLLVEDGFLRAMVLTSNFTEKENNNHIVFVGEARHVFDSPRRIHDIFRHNVRLAVGTEINRILYEHFRTNIFNEGIAEYIRERNAINPNWIGDVVESHVKIDEPIFVPKNHALRRLRVFMKTKNRFSVKNVSILLIGVLFDLVVSCAAGRLCGDEHGRIFGNCVW